MGTSRWAKKKTPLITPALTQPSPLGVHDKQGGVFREEPADRRRQLGSPRTVTTKEIGFLLSCWEVREMCKVHSVISVKSPQRSLWKSCRNAATPGPIVPRGPVVHGAGVQCALVNWCPCGWDHCRLERHQLVLALSVYISSITCMETKSMLIECVGDAIRREMLNMTDEEKSRLTCIFKNSEEPS